ncbi:MAG: hypothetical protein PHF64_08945, partial [Methanoregula sp.]|nr:hypothetical protein [Methanoregula sp.]
VSAQELGRITTTMSDFVPKSVVKSASRALTTPIADAVAFDTIVDAVVSGNPFSCTTYTVSGETLAAVAITKRTYGTVLVWEDVNAKKCGNTSEKYDTKAGFDAGTAILMGSATLATAHAGTCIHDPELDTFSATIRCHDANGELYTVTVARETITVTSYSDDAILAKVETWADGVPALA